MTGRDHRKLTIISTYRTYQSSIKNKGPLTNIMQQWKRLEEQTIEDTDVRNKMIIDLASFINKLQNQQHEILVRIDANEPNDQPKNGVNNKSKARNKKRSQHIRKRK